MNTNRVNGCNYYITHIIATLCSILISTQVLALPGDYIITRITNDQNDEFTNENPQISDNGYLVWEKYEFLSPNSDIHLWNGTSVIQLTNNTDDDQDPQLNASGHAVWSSIGEIFLWDGTSTIQITNSPTIFDQIPQINDIGQIVWVGENLAFSDIGIYFWDGAGTTPITGGSGALTVYPQINNSGMLAWMGFSGFDYDIAVYDTDTNTSLFITDNAYDDIFPYINNSGEVVWMGHDGSDYEIFLWDGASVIQITDNAYDDDEPRINESGQLTWYGWDGSDYEIFLWDGASIIQITDNIDDDFGPRINDSGQLAWYDNNGTSNAVYLWDGTSIILLSNSATQPQINNSGQVVWVSDKDIFLATPDTTLVSEPLIAHYPFTGDASDISGNTLHGIILGGAGFTTGADGNPNGAIALDGTDDYVQLPFEWAYDLEAFTLAATLRVPDYSNESWLISKGFNWGNYSLKIIDSTHPFFPGHADYNHDFIGGTSYGMLVTNTPVPTNQFFSLAVTLSASGDLKSYYNGKPIYATSSVPTPALNNQPANIGAGGFSTISEFFKGDIDEFRIYNVALSNTEIRDLHDTPPVADAGSDQTVTAGDVVTLNGSASYDPDGHTPLSYAWTIVTSPAGSTATLSDPTGVGPSFIADLPGDYTIELVVSDSLGLASIADSVVITADIPLTITGIWPATATVGENVSVFIFGSAFTTDNSTDVYFNGVQQLFVAPVSDEMLIVRLSPVTADLFGPVTVTTPTDSVTSTIEFGAPQISLSITGIWPSTAPIGVSSSVFIFGSEFTIDGSTEVYFNGVRQFLVAPVSEEMLIVRVLGDASLTGPVQIVTPAGSVTSTDTLTFIP